MDNSIYFMEDPREAARLVAKVEPAEWVARYLTDLLPGCSEVLDVGCGPGAIAAATARAAPQARTVGVDRSGVRLGSATRDGPPNRELCAGAAEDLPFEAGRFDLVYTRFMLEYLERREQAVREMSRVCKPGGHVLLQDLDGQLLWHYPEDAGLQTQIARVLEGLAAQTGFDPFVGRKLFSLARLAGLTNIRVTAESYHLYAGRIDEYNLSLWDTKLEIAMPIAAHVLGSREAAEELKGRFLDYLLREDTLTYSVVFTVIGTKPSVSPMGTEQSIMP